MSCLATRSRPPRPRPVRSALAVGRPTVRALIRPLTGGVWRVAFSSYGRLLAPAASAGRGGYGTRPPATACAPWAHRLSLGVAFNPGGRLLATADGGRDHAAIKLTWPVGSHQPRIERLPPTPRSVPETTLRPVASLNFSQDNREVDLVGPTGAAGPRTRFDIRRLRRKASAHFRGSEGVRYWLAWHAGAMARMPSCHCLLRAPDRTTHTSEVCCVKGRTQLRS